MSTAASCSGRASDLIHRLESQGQPSKKEWWEKYLKHQIQFYGVPMNDIRKTIKDWKGDASEEELLSVALNDLFPHEVSEPKLAAILILQEHVLDVLNPEVHMPIFASLFDNGYLSDWHHTDWFCTKVLGKLIELHPETTTDALRNEWSCPSHTLWQRRASLVAFVNVTKDHKDCILEIASRLCKDQERFAQTAIGWCLRSLSATEPEAVQEFLKTNNDSLSQECLNMASAKLNDRQRKAAGITGKRKRR